MNQILEPKFQLEKNSINRHSKSKAILSTQAYKIYFIFFSSIAIILLISLLIKLYHKNKQENLSLNLLKSYTVSTLYSNTNDYQTNPLNNSITTNNMPFVIGMLKIDKINLNYPILSETTKKLLEISICRFAGPLPNEIGNLCIAGHNYVDYKLFSRLYELEINDTFKVYDLNGQMIEYIIIKKYESDVNDLSCTIQNTNGEKFVTLLTCNNVNGKRLVVVGKQK